MSLRRRLFKLHRAVGVGVAAVLVITALTGTLLVLRDYLRAAPPPRTVATGSTSTTTRRPWSTWRATALCWRRG